MLERTGCGQRLLAADSEPHTDRNRLELLAVVRGLEALGQPSQVTLLTRSRYVRRGIRHDLGHWREANWQWESFGKLVPIRDLDLWQRVDRALAFHQIECPQWQWEEVPHETARATLRSPIAVPATVGWAPPTMRAFIDDKVGSAHPTRLGPLVRRRRGRLGRSSDDRPRRGLGQWGQGVLAAMTTLTRHPAQLVGAGHPRPALSRTA